MPAACRRFRFSVAARTVACCLAWTAVEAVAQQFQPTVQQIPAAPQQPIYLQQPAQAAPGQGAAELETINKRGRRSTSSPS